MSDFIFRISPNIMMGPYTVSRLGQQVQEWGTRFMVIMDPILNEVKLADKISQSLQDRKIDYFLFSELTEGSSSRTIERALALAKQGHIHGVISVAKRNGNYSVDMCTLARQECTYQRSFTSLA